MTDTIRLRTVFDGETVGRYIEESVRSYADKIIANENGEFTEDDIDLVKAMLNYGGLAQIYFGYNTDNLANEGIDVSHLENTATAGVFTTEGDRLDGFTPSDWSLALESNVKIRLYAEITNIDDYFITVENIYTGEVEMIIPTHQGGNVYRIEIDVSDVKFIDDVYRVDIHELSTGKVMHVAVSAMRYLDKVCTSTWASDSLIALCEAMKIYCSVANGYV
jgi:hypothetical protein